MVLSDAKVVLLEVNSLAVTLKCQPGCDQIRVIMTHTCDRGRCMARAEKTLHCFTFDDIIFTFQYPVKIPSAS